jgi:Pyruvate/2-oxoacid:ferredoxin oxidoreductase delta subunit
MDGIMAMEGNGPAGGEAVPMNVLLFSTDPVALDAVMCRLVDLDPLYVPTSALGRRLGLGTYLTEEIELAGDPIGRLANGDFQVKRGPVKSFTTQGVLTYINNLLADRPVIDAGLCSRCGQCVEACPAQPKALTWSGRASPGRASPGRASPGRASLGRTAPGRARPPKHNYIHCIRCYCCQEICPEGAISVKRSVLGLS